MHDINSRPVEIAATHTHSFDLPPAPKHLSASRIISPRRIVETVEYRITYRTPAGDFSFPSDRWGNVHRKFMSPSLLESFDRCQKSCEGTLEELGSIETIPAVMKCDCGKRLELDSGWSNACECGREFNGSGQLLAPREDWGEETGERFY